MNISSDAKNELGFYANRWLNTAEDVAAGHNITACYRCTCTAGYELGHSRSHAHVKERKICLSSEPRGKTSFFGFLHEIGHIVAEKANYHSGVPRALAEYNATEWAKREMRENLHMSIPRKITQSYDRYIKDKVERGLRCGLAKIPAELKHYNAKA